MMMHPKIIHANANLFTLANKTCLGREILETEKIVFGEKEDMTFAEGGQEVCMSLSDRDKNFCSRSVFRSIEC